MYSEQYLFLLLSRILLTFLVENQGTEIHNPKNLLLLSTIHHDLDRKLKKNHEPFSRTNKRKQIVSSTCVLCALLCCVSTIRLFLLRQTMILLLHHDPSCLVCSKQTNKMIVASVYTVTTAFNVITHRMMFLTNYNFTGVNYRI